MLHIANGSSVSLPDTGLSGEIVYWADVLHEGPVPRLPLENLSQLRASFIARAYGGSEDEIRTQFERRDAALQSFAGHEEVVLWFEHDLYDQLQLLQILDYLAGQTPGPTRVSLIQSDVYLGPMRAGELAELFPARRTVTRQQFGLAQRAWNAFRSPDPRDIAALLAEDTGVLPHLRAAMHRHLEQFPGQRNGLNRTQSQILRCVSEGASTIRDAFLADQKLEEAIFMGDSIYSSYVQGLAACPRPLIHTPEPLQLTEIGQLVLAGQADHLHLNGIDRWLGGVHLSSPDRVWRWNGSSFDR